MVLLTIFLLAGIDQAVNPKSRQTIGKRVRLGLTDKEFSNLTIPFQGEPRRGKRRFVPKRNFFGEEF